MHSHNTMHAGKTCAEQSTLHFVLPLPLETTHHSWLHVGGARELRWSPRAAVEPKSCGGKLFWAAPMENHHGNDHKSTQRTELLHFFDSAIMTSTSGHPVMQRKALRRRERQNVSADKDPGGLLHNTTKCQQPSFQQKEQNQMSKNKPQLSLFCNTFCTLILGIAPDICS